MAIHRKNVLIVWLTALSFNAIVALLINSPGPSLDAAYYFTGGVLIVEQGWPFQEPYFWNYLNPPDMLPHPAFGYWQPLPSFIAAIGLLADSRSFGAAQVPFLVLATILPVLTYAVTTQLDSRDDNHKRAFIAGLLMCFGGFYVANWTIPESFTPFAVSGATCLFLLSMAAQRQLGWLWLLTGVCAGLAYLTRSDGLLLLLVAWCVAVIGVRRSQFSSSVTGIILATIGFVLVSGPWLARNLQLYGSLQPPGGLSTIFLLEYNDLFRFPAVVSAERFISKGVGFVTRTRLEVLGTNLVSFVAVNNLIFLTPFTLVSLWNRWRSPWVQPVVIYGGALFVAMTFVFSYPGQRGGWFHSSAALMPFIVSVAVLGLEDCLRWASARIDGWRFRQTWAVFAPAMVVFAAGLTLYLIFRSLSSWNAENDTYSDLAVVLEEIDVEEDGVIMSNNTPLAYYHSGQLGVPLVTGGLDEVLASSRHYGVDYVLVPTGVDILGAEPDPTCFEVVSAVGPGDTLYQIICEP